MTEKKEVKKEIPDFLNKRNIVIGLVAVLVLIIGIYFINSFFNNSESSVNQERPIMGEFNDNGVPKEADTITNVTKNLTEKLKALQGNLTNEEKRNYLMNEWRTMLLKNDIVKSFDYVCNKMTWVFKVLFGQYYSLSLELLFIIVFWVIFVVNIYKIISVYGLFSGSVSLILSVALGIVVAQLQILRLISDFFMNLFVSTESRFFRISIFLVIFILCVLVSWLNNKFANQIKEGRKAIKEAEEKARRIEINAYSDSLKTSVGV